MINKQGLHKILEIDGKLIQKMDQIYLDPPIDGLIRAHFFAPRKALGGNYYDTFWINSFVIWFMSLVMAITLYFDVLKKFLDSIEKVFGRFAKNKR
jgi:serine phosphatase RsbU (regulator of sigma subunit)